jgi:hypothetical protein
VRLRDLLRELVEAAGHVAPRIVLPRDQIGQRGHEVTREGARRISAQDRPRCS